MQALISQVEQDTRQWVERLVIGQNLCPFAGREWRQHRVRCEVTLSSTVEALLHSLAEELEILRSKAEIETTLLIHPLVLTAFDDYLDFLDLANSLLDAQGLVGQFQVASFHPQYCFADAAVDDPANASNRSPWPMIHLLREASLERAIAAHPNTEDIPIRNIALLRELGAQGIEQVLNAD